MFHNPYLPEIIENIFPTLSFMVTVEEKEETEGFFWNALLKSWSPLPSISEHKPLWWNFA